MHQSVMTFTQRFVQMVEPPFLEVGSYDVNGSVRELFPEYQDLSQYHGVDIYPGPGVNRVIDPLKPLPYGDESFATVISTEMLEHALDPVFCMREMARVMRKGGLLLVTARGNGFPHHNPPDRWRVMPGTLQEWSKMLGLEVLTEELDTQVPGVFLAARRPL
jgi:SAM-dependent methyltransferase